MPDEARSSSGKQFADDLRRIREARGLSVDELHRTTKIPRMLIESFEADGLFEHPMFNRVYLRSFVRTYAGLLGMPADRALDALERALAGQYDGGLKEEVLGDRSSVVRSADAEDAAAEDATAKEERRAEAAPDEGPRPRVEEQAAAGAAASGASASAGRPEPESAPAPPEEEAGTSWSEQSPPGVAGETERRRAPDQRSETRRRSESGSSAGKAAAAVAVLILLGLGAFFLFRSGTDEGATVASPQETTAAPPDEAAAPPRPPADLTLGETLMLTMVAEDGPIRGVRLTRDSDLRRPYWIEQGQATVFPFQDRVVVEEDEQIAKARLLLEGYPYPMDRRDDEGRLVIDRQAAQAFADTLHGEPISLSAAPDTNRIPTPR